MWSGRVLEGTITSVSPYLGYKQVQAGLFSIKKCTLFTGSHLFKRKRQHTYKQKFQSATPPEALHPQLISLVLLLQAHSTLRLSYLEPGPLVGILRAVHLSLLSQSLELVQQMPYPVFSPGLLQSFAWEHFLSEPVPLSVSLCYPGRYHQEQLPKWLP